VTNDQLTFEVTLGKQVVTWWFWMWF